MFEKHFKNGRANVSEENKWCKYFLDKVGPPISKADMIIRKAINLHFKSGRWHFLRRDIEHMFKSPIVLSRHLNKNAAFLFLTKEFFIALFQFSRYVHKYYQESMLTWKFARMYELNKGKDLFS